MSKHDQFIRLTHFLFAIKSGLGVKSGWRLDILFTLVLLFIVLETDFLLYVLSPAWISWYIFSTLFTTFRPIKSTLYSVFYPQIETFLPLKSLFMSILCCQKAFQIIQNLQHIFWTWVWSPPPFWTMFKKNADLAEVGSPYQIHCKPHPWSRPHLHLTPDPHQVWLSGCKTRTSLQNLRVNVENEAENMEQLQDQYMRLVSLSAFKWVVLKLWICWALSFIEH